MNKTIYADNTTLVSSGEPGLIRLGSDRVVVLDPSRIDGIVLSFVMPSDYAPGSNVTGRVWCESPAGVVGTARVRLEFALVDLAQSTDSFAAAQESNWTAPATISTRAAAQFTLNNAALALATAGAHMRVRVSRIGTDTTNDTLAALLYLRGLVLSQ